MSHVRALNQAGRMKARLVHWILTLMVVLAFCTFQVKSGESMRNLLKRLTSDSLCGENSDLC